MDTDGASASPTTPRAHCPPPPPPPIPTPRPPPPPKADALWNSVGTFVRSTDTGTYNKFGEAERVVSQSRTSQNAWCRAGCEDHPMVVPIIKRIEQVTGASYDNSENFQVMRVNPESKPEQRQT